ncbi:MAG: hypothetical protein JWO04_5198 [Gammaproteobacteria bacterium]|nr:hypothetical protein [Gammaproteobacteria bacterium]
MGDFLLPKQMLYQAELRPDRARHPSSFASQRNAKRRDATEIHLLSEAYGRSTLT